MTAYTVAEVKPVDTDEGDSEFEVALSRDSAASESEAAKPSSDVGGRTTGTSVQTLLSDILSIGREIRKVRGKTTVASVSPFVVSCALAPDVVVSCSLGYDTSLPRCVARGCIFGSSHLVIPPPPCRPANERCSSHLVIPTPPADRQTNAAHWYRARWYRWMR